MLFLTRMIYVHFTKIHNMLTQQFPQNGMPVVVFLDIYDTYNINIGFLLSLTKNEKKDISALCSTVVLILQTSLDLKKTSKRKIHNRLTDASKVFSFNIKNSQTH